MSHFDAVVGNCARRIVQILTFVTKLVWPNTFVWLAFHNVLSKGASAQAPPPPPRLTT